MSKIVTALGAAFILLGAWVAIDPAQFFSLLDLGSRQGQYLAAGIRILLGIALMVTASATRYPQGLKIFGGVVLLAGLGILLIPFEAWTKLVSWFLVGHPVLVRVLGATVGMGLGAVLVHAARPGRAAHS